MESCKLNSSDLLYDAIRKSWVKRTPEEVVRQTLLQAMVGKLGFPPSLIAVEKELKSMPHLKNYPHKLPDRRADVVCFSSVLYRDNLPLPLLLIECKENRIDQAAKEQVLGYNAFVQARFVALASPEGIRLLLPEGKEVIGLPRYEELLMAVH